MPTMGNPGTALPIEVASDFIAGSK